MNFEPLADTVQKRWGYYFGVRQLTSEKMKNTAQERTHLRRLGKGIRETIEKIDENPKNAPALVRVKKTKALEYATVREGMRKKAKPFDEKISPLRKVISHFDKVEIPNKLADAGRKASPVFVVQE